MAPEPSTVRFLLCRPVSKMAAKGGRSRSFCRARLPLALLLAMALMLIPSPRAGAQSEDAAGPKVTVHAGTPMVIEFVAERYAIETVSAAGGRYSTIEMAGLTPGGEPGQPQLPVYSILVGVPATEKLALKVVHVDEFSVSVPYPLLPAPESILQGDGLEWPPAAEFASQIAPDAAIYATDAFFPQIPAEVSLSGYVRDQAVAQIRFRPVRYHPARGELRIVTKLVVALTWDEAPDARHSRDGSPVSEEWLARMLLNYAALPRPAVSSRTGKDDVNPEATILTGNSQRGDVGPGLKIGVDDGGLYRLTYADLQGSGFDIGTDPRRWRMDHRDGEIALFVAGEEDGRFDPQDYLIFYGEEVRDLYTERNIYRLSMGSGPGLRMAVRDVAPDPATPLLSTRFSVRFHAEEDTRYWQNMPAGSGSDRWFWESRLGPNTQGLPAARSYTLRLGAVASPAPAATLRVRLMGYTGLGHRTQIVLNDQLVDDRAWSGQTEFTHEVAVDHNLLRAGDNILRVQAVDTGAVVDQLLVNWIELDYWGDYRATNGVLTFGVPTGGHQRIQVDGFVGTDLTLLDLSEGQRPVRLVNFAATGADGRSTLLFSDSPHPEIRYLALESAMLKSPAALTLDSPSGWRSPDNGADYVLITHDAFYAAALRLAEHRRNQGLRVAVVRVEDLYDEFNGGIFNPRAIRDFLAYAYEHWQGAAPSYVLLVGDAYQDYRDKLQTGTRVYVPSQNIESSLFGEVSSDNWFVTVSGADPLPDMLIGRLAVDSQSQADAVVDKLIAYDASAADEGWNRSVLFVNGTETEVFPALSNRLALHLPFGYVPSFLSPVDRAPEAVRAAIVDQINEGRVLVNYSGHGEYFSWGLEASGSGLLFAADDVARLSNRERLPLITVANCLNGFFAGPAARPALAELLQRREGGGALAVWAPTGLAQPEGHAALFTALYQALFTRDLTTLGASTAAAKIEAYGISTAWGELAETYVLFGDPASRLAIPPVKPYVEAATPADGATGVPIDPTLTVRFNKAIAPATFQLLLDGQPEAIAAAWNEANTVVTVNGLRLDYGRSYRIAVAATDVFGRPLDSGPVANPWSITISDDAFPPSVEMTVLAGSPDHALTTTPIQLVFSEPVRPESVRIVSTPAVEGAVFWLDAATGLFHHQGMRPNQRYTFTIEDAVDATGNHLWEPVRLAISTVDTTLVFLPIGGH